MTDETLIERKRCAGEIMSIRFLSLLHMSYQASCEFSSCQVRRDEYLYKYEGIRTYLFVRRHFVESETRYRIAFSKLSLALHKLVLRGFMCAAPLQPTGGASARRYAIELL
jgi:hypothetical protein